MVDQIILKNYRQYVDDTFVGFHPNGASIKPVHISSGALRCVYGGYNTSMQIKHLALVSDSKGIIPKGNELDTVYNNLIADDCMEDGISKSSLESLRNIMQRLLDADKGVYVVKGLPDKMLSYSAGSKYFLTRVAQYEDAGEFIGGLIREYCPDLAQYIKNILDKGNDSISLLFEPVLEDSLETFENIRHEGLPAFEHPNESMEWYLKGLKNSASCLMDNFKRHTNPLTQLRLFNFFCIFQLLRYMAMLESFYCNQKVRAVLLDFSGLAPSQSSIARASEMSYTQMNKSINRFYAWGFARKLEENGLGKKDLMKSETPIYSEKKPSKSEKEELDALWNLAKDRASACANDDDARLVFGETMYDMLALEASSHPVTYLRNLGTSSSILYPPDRMHPNKRFVLSQDILEMLLRGVVEPDEILSASDLRNRLWNRFGIIIGGSTSDMESLKNSGMLLQIDEDSLERNFNSFSSLLESMDFAEVMADGILQIRLGGID